MSNDNGQDRPRRNGYTKPNTTPVPDQFFDEDMPNLKLGELKVLLYIIRRTFGFKRESDNISLKQMQEGITTKEGKVLDRGTGIKDKKTLLAAINSLEEMGLIVTETRSSPERGDLPTNYRLNIADGNIPLPLAGKSPHPPRLEIPATPRGENPPSQETVVQQTDNGELSTITESLRSVLKEQMTRATWEQHIRGLQVVSVEGGAVVLQVVRPESREWLAGRMAGQVRDALEGLGLTVGEVQFVTG